MARRTGFGPTMTDAATSGTSAPVVADFTTDPAVTGDSGKVTPNDADRDAVTTRNMAAATIGLGLIALWLFGGVVFRDAKL